MKLAGIAIYLFGNKIDANNTSARNIINADGLQKEFDIAQEYALVHIPVKGTGYKSAELSDSFKQKSYQVASSSNLFQLYENLDGQTNPDSIIEAIVSIIKEINK